MEVGIDSFAAIIPDLKTGIPIFSAAERMQALLQEVVTADRVGLDSFGIGEHHREEFLDSAPAVILAAAAALTNRIRLTSAVTVLSAADPVRVFQEFATVDLISNGRAELSVGRGSFGEAFPLFGFSMADYDALFAEKLELLLKIRESTTISWKGRFRAPLNAQSIFPRPKQDKLPIWLGVGGTPSSFARAGKLGLPLMIGAIGGALSHFAPHVALYRETSIQAGFPCSEQRVGLHAMGFVAETDAAAKEAFYPGWAYLLTKVGRERGWPPASRAQFEAMCSPDGAFLIGSPATVAKKILLANQALGGIDRVTFQMTTAMLGTEAMQRSIELLGTEVAPLVRNAG